ncbi:MAG: histidine phosphatase family protein [Candidatus Thorarchaeota archaeon]
MNSADEWSSYEWLSEARNLVRWVNTLKPPSLILIRHSERLVNLSPSATIKAELTKVGHQMAKEFGRRLPTNKQIIILHSPNIRTTQTAERISEGVVDAGGSIIRQEKLDILWGPESDYSKFASLLTEFGFSEVYSRWINGLIPNEVFEPIDHFFERFLPHTLGRLSKAESNTLEIHVTHDLVIDIAQRKFLGINTESNYFDIPFLGGLGFVKIESTVQGYHKQENYPLAFEYP